jgi:ABC-type Zn uptake system ZnuABC Zn-binding protein ZnuA
MTKLKTLALATALLAMLAAVPAGVADQGSPQPATDPISVVTTMPIPYDITLNVGGDVITITTIVDGSQDIHTYQGPTQTQKNQIAAADLLVAMGVEDLEPWLEETLGSLGTQAPEVLYLVTESMIRNDPVLDGEENPHVWLDPNNVKLMASAVEAKLVEIDAAQAAAYEANGVAYRAALDGLLAEIEGNKTTFAGVKVVEHHPAFMYLLDLLEIERVAAVEKVEGQEPSAAWLSELATLIAEQEVDYIVSMPQMNEKTPEDLAAETGIQIVELTPFPVPNDQGGMPKTYIEMIRFNIDALQNPRDPEVGGIPGYPLLALALASLGAVALISARKRV